MENNSEVKFVSVKKVYICTDDEPCADDEHNDESDDCSHREGCRLHLTAGWYYKGGFYLIMLLKFLSGSLMI